MGKKHWLWYGIVWTFAIRTVAPKIQCISDFHSVNQYSLKNYYKDKQRKDSCLEKANTSWVTLVYIKILIFTQKLWKYHQIRNSWNRSQHHY